MGALKDVVDLSTQLANSVKDRKFAADLFKVIELINIVRAEQAGLTEDNIQLMSDKAKLQKLVISLEDDISKLKEEIIGLNEPAEDEVNEEATQILKIMFETQSEYSIDKVAQDNNLAIGDAYYHFDVLKSHGYIVLSTHAIHDKLPSWRDRRSGNTALINRPEQYKITDKGRAFVIKNKIT